jgi:rubrerythrin
LKGIGSTEDNLKKAIEGEHFETSDMYPTFVKEAREEGNEEAAKLFEEIGKVEAHHEDRYKKLLKMVQEGNVYKRKNSIAWKCAKCGYIHNGTEAPEECPSCKHPKEYYEPECMCFSETCEKCQGGN